MLAMICVLASFYWEGHTTANQEHFRPEGLTAAHRTLPFGTRLRVHYKDRSIVVRINDRGPYVAGRDLDLTRGGARRLGMMKIGVARVCYERIT